MLGLMIAYNSYCINYYTLHPELLYQTDINHFDDEHQEKITRTLMELEVSRRFSFHSKISNFLSSINIVINTNYSFVKKFNCDAITEIMKHKIQNMDKSLKLAKELRILYEHGRLLPLHFESKTTFGKYNIDTIFHIVINKEYLVSKDIKSDVKQHLKETNERSIDLYDLFKRHFDFNIDLYNSIRDEFLKQYVVCDTTRFFHQQHCLCNGIEQKFELITQ